MLRGGYIHRDKFHTKRRGLIIFQGSGVSTTRRCRPYILAGLRGTPEARVVLDERICTRRRIEPACNADYGRHGYVSSSLTPCHPAMDHPGLPGEMQAFNLLYTRSAGAAPVRRRRSVDPGRAVAGTLVLIILNVSFLVSSHRHSKENVKGTPWTAAASLRKVASVRETLDESRA